jgi:alanine racemase
MQGRGTVQGGRPTQARIDLSALRENYALARQRADGRDVIAVVKADAYGHGARAVVRALRDAGCPRFATVTLEEAAVLRDDGAGEPILVLGGIHGPEEAAAAAARRLTPVLHHARQLPWLAAAGRASDAPLPVHVEVDTGMRRMGVPPDEAVTLLEAVMREPALALDGVYTHLARADEPDLEPSLEQLRRFREILGEARRRGVEPGIVHFANSAGLLATPLAAALPEAAAVRPVLMLYGVRPAPHLQGALRPVMTLRTRVVQVRRVSKGEAVGYAATFRAPRDTRVATLPLGYADGVPVAASNRGHVLLRGRRLPIAGRVSMDYVGVDVGDAPVEPGDEAVLFGAGGDGALPVEDAARAAETIGYELLVRVGRRVPRVVVD